MAISYLAVPPCASECQTVCRQNVGKKPGYHPKLALIGLDNEGYFFVLKVSPITKRTTLVKIHTPEMTNILIGIHLSVCENIRRIINPVNSPVVTTMLIMNPRAARDTPKKR
ncbi:MAG: hypothetical protein FJ023_09395 [Chloroflexi bacterium]|nr:hypothetical protein [Chloroflexota bacterium]